jgi:hypothetical protein
MWDDYASLEDSWKGKIKVITLRMLRSRITYHWLQGDKKKKRSSREK